MVEVLVQVAIILLVAMAIVVIVRLAGPILQVDAATTDVITKIIGVLALVAIVIVLLGLLRGAPVLRLGAALVG